jgi:hypothetical protein
VLKVYFPYETKNKLRVPSGLKPASFAGLGVTVSTGCGKSRSGYRFWVAQRFSAAIAAVF